MTQTVYGATPEREGVGAKDSVGSEWVILGRNS